MEKINNICLQMMDMRKLQVIVLVFIFIPLLFTCSEESKDTAKKYHVLMIIAEKNFRDEELFIPQKLFEEKGITVTIASTVTSTVTGMLNGKAKPDVLLKNVKVKDYDAVIFVGGVGAQMYFNNEVAHQIAKDAVKEHKVLAAICIAPNILANAGLLQGKKATCWDSAILTPKGAEYQNKDVVKDGKIITANGPKAAHEFGQIIIKTLIEG
jgi:protease I